MTPDSFSDGGHFSNIDIALKQAVKMVEQGAAIIDIGGESTRPGASDVSLQQERRDHVHVTALMNSSQLVSCAKAVSSYLGLYSEDRYGM